MRGIIAKNSMKSWNQGQSRREKAHVYSGTNNAIDRYEIPKSFKKNTFDFVRTRASFQIGVMMTTRRCENDVGKLGNQGRH